MGKSRETGDVAISLPGVILYGVLAPPVRAGGVRIVPALFDFEDDAGGRAECGVEGFVDLEADQPMATALAEFGEGFAISCWVRARIPAVFGVTRPTTQGDWESPLLDFPFLAVLRPKAGDQPEVVPFLCVEGDGAELVFRRSDTDWALKQRVASAFWGLLLREPDDLRPFEVSLQEEGWVKAGYAGGEFFYCELEHEEEDGEPIRGFDPHLAPAPGEVFCCPDCGGDGVEDRFPFTEDCSACGGNGVVAW
jgi:hypothetical protein